MRIPVVYSQLMVADSGNSASPSASKPALVAQALRTSNYPVDFHDPEPVTVEEIQRVHDPRFVRAVLEGREDNGFGNRSAEVARSLPYTSGSLLTAAKLALGPKRPAVVASLSAGFHHATFSEAADFCTFNGFMIAAADLIAHSRVERLAIIDADYHYGNGTDDILTATGLSANVFHYSFGRDFTSESQALAYLEKMKNLEVDLARFNPQLIIYSAGVDAHVEDPLGGMLTTEQLGARDELMFQIAKRLGVPVVFNLAGGYQRDPDGGISKVVKLHLNTFSAALRVHDSVA